MTNDEKIATLITTALKLAGQGQQAEQPAPTPPATLPPNASQPPQQNTPPVTPPVNNTLPNGAGGMTPTPLDINAVKSMTADEINNRWDEVSKLLQGENVVESPTNSNNIGV